MVHQHGCHRSRYMVLFVLQWSAFATFSHFELFFLLEGLLSPCHTVYTLCIPTPCAINVFGSPSVHVCVDYPCPPLPCRLAQVTYPRLNNLLLYQHFQAFVPSVSFAVSGSPLVGDISFSDPNGGGLSLFLGNTHVATRVIQVSHPTTYACFCFSVACFLPSPTTVPAQIIWKVLDRDVLRPDDIEHSADALRCVWRGLHRGEGMYMTQYFG